MRTKTDPESDEERTVRRAEETRQRNQRSAAEDSAMDAAVRRSIDKHGA